MWAAQWPDDPRLLAARDRFSRILLHYCQWPNAFFIPFDDIYPMMEAGEFESIDLVEFLMVLEDVFDLKISNEQASKVLFFEDFGKSTYGQFLESIIAIREPGAELIGAGYK